MVKKLKKNFGFSQKIRKEKSVCINASEELSLNSQVDHASQLVEEHQPHEIDCDFYSQFYPDLSKLNHKQLIDHWHKNGKLEKRFGNLKQALRHYGVSYEAFNSSEVDASFYLKCYPDLVKNGIDSELKAILHYFVSGKKEKRWPSLKAVLEHAGIQLEVNELVLMETHLKDCNEEIFSSLVDTLSGEKIIPVEVGTAKQSAVIYLSIAKEYLKHDDKVKGRSFLKIAISFVPSSEAFELLGNVYLDYQLYEAAFQSYQQSLQLDPTNYWALRNTVRMLVDQKRFSEALFFILDIFKQNSGITSLIDLVDEVSQQYYEYTHANLGFECDLELRAQILSMYDNYAHNVYQTYQGVFGEEQSSCLKSLNLNRILIIGDFHVPQCVRYRIDQKVEQLAIQGKEVQTVDWLDLDKEWNQLCYFDVVIFYRVPSLPKLLKAMAQVNSAGKLSIYEIDDLLFDVEYPPALETFGGYIDLHVYHELMKGAGMFYAAAKCCRIGIASTHPLANALKELVFDHQCLLHRNGLDQLNEFLVTDKSHKTTIDLFYGSGTMAHNSDFIEQILPALERLLLAYPQVRLIIAGYLKLPECFTTQFKHQLKQIPPVKNVKNYWTLLEQADINLAVLHEDKVTNAKSELKWFEAACFGIPSVLSSTENYRDVIHQNEDAILVETTEGWFEALASLIESPEKRKKIGLNALERVQQEYSLDSLGSELVTQLSEYTKSKAVQTARKKLLLVNVFFAPQSIGGATRVVEDNLDVLLDQYGDQYDITVFTADVNMRDTHQLSFYKHKGVNVYRVTTLFRENMDWHPKDETMYALFSEFLEAEQFDFVHFHCVQRLTASIVEATKDAKIPYFITVHDAWWISDYQFLVDQNDKVYPNGHPDPFEVLPLPNNVTWDQSLERRHYLKGLLNAAEKAFVVSESFANIYRNNGIHNVVVTKNGLSEKINWLPKDTSYTDKVVCALIGGMSAHKGYEILKAAIMQEQPEHCEFVFVDHSKESGYELNEKWGAVPIKFIGREKQSDIVNLYRKIDVLFAPSIWPESFGLVTREAEACGCWVVASNLGGIGEDVIEGQNGHVIDPNESALSAVLSKIDMQPGKYKALSKRNNPNPVSQQVKEIVEFYK